MKSILFLVIFLITSISFANTSATTVDSGSIPWSFEGGMTAQTINNMSSPSVGATALFHHSESFNFGMRASTTLNSTRFEVGHRLEAIQRFKFYRSKTDLFIELSQGYFEDFADDYTTVGSTIGLNHKLGNDISFGGLAGVDYVSTFAGAFPKVSTFVSVRL